MSLISRKFEANVASTQITSIAQVEKFFSVEPLLDVFEGCVVQIDVNFVITPTDNLVINIYAKQDGSNFDITPFMTLVVDKDTDPNRLTFIIEKVREFKVGVVTAGSTDTHTSADMDTRLWRHEVV